MPAKTKTVQFNTYIKEEQRDKLKELIPDGMTSHVMQSWMDTLIELLEDKDGYAILGMLSTGQVIPNQLFSLREKD